MGIYLYIRQLNSLSNVPLKYRYISLIEDEKNKRRGVTKIIFLAVVLVVTPCAQNFCASAQCQLQGSARAPAKGSYITLSGDIATLVCAVENIMCARE